MENTQRTHRFSNYKKTINISDNDWHSAKSGRIYELNVTVQSNNYLILQEQLHTNIKLFDSLIKTEQHGMDTAIRLVTCGEAEKANNLAIQLANNGYFTSAVFFPVVPRGKAAIRITLRADMSHDTIRSFCSELTRLLEENTAPH